MSSPILFYTNPQSRGRIVRWMLEEIGQPYQTEVLGYGTTMKSPSYLAINPMGKVPALRHGDQVVTEAAAICAYLADAFPNVKLAPPTGSPMRAPYYRWMFFAAGPLEAAVNFKALGMSIPAGKEPMVGFGTMETTLNAIEGAVSKSTFICGEQFTAADVYVGSHLGFGMQFGMIENRPTFERYVAKLVARPAWIRAHQIDDQLANEQKAKT